MGIVFKLINIISISITSFCFAQNFRVFYDYKFKQDSLNRHEIQNETMVLEINKNTSYFFPYDEMISDSIISHRFKQGKYDFTNLKHSKVNFRVSKENQKINLYQSIGAEWYSIPMQKIQWKLTNSTKEVRQIKVQKATATYMGRNWIAWYSDDYPIADGAFVFSGLPGLILEVYDDREDHYFSFSGIKNIDPNSFFLIGDKHFKATKIENIKQFQKQWEMYIQDPAKSYKNRMKNSGLQYNISIDGISDENKIIKQMEEQEKKRIQKENNPILLEMYRLKVTKIGNIENCLSFL